MRRSAPRADAIAIPIIPMIRALLLLLGLAVVGTLLYILYLHRDDLFARSTIERYIDPRSYQAVFLTTQQVYFGKLTIDGDVYLLSDVYYVNEQQSGGGQLVKRGGEVHAPRDLMLISARQVLYVENVRDDSQVAQAIRLIQSGQAPPASSPAPTTPRPSPTR